jgi:hypothetical protein
VEIPDRWNARVDDFWREVEAGLATAPQNTEERDRPALVTT